MYVFPPTPSIRALDLREYVDRKITVNLSNLSTTGDSQYVRFSLHGDEEVDFDSPVGHLSGWTECRIGTATLGEEGTKVKAQVVRAYLMNHKNGGRMPGEFSTYDEFFNEDRKRQVQADLGAEFFAKIGRGGGDIDRADVIVDFRYKDKTYTVDSFAWGIEAPGEWYSEHHAKNRIFNFVDGFYPDPETAIAVFSQKASDDLFGTRFFPVIVLPKENGIKAEYLREMPKAASPVIVKDDYVIFGARCKPYEYAELIRETYRCGGQVPIGLEWSW